MHSLAQKILGYTSLVLITSTSLFAENVQKNQNDCERRLSNNHSLSYQHSDRHVASNTLDIYYRLREILDSIPPRIKEAPFATLVTSVNVYFTELFNLRHQVYFELQEMIEQHQEHKISSYLNSILDKLSITQERKDALVKSFSAHDHIQLGVLLNRRRDDFPFPDTIFLINYLDELAGTLRGFLSEVIVGLEQENVRDVSVKMGVHLFNNYDQASIQYIRSKMGEEDFTSLAEFEIDAIYETAEAFYLVEVKNSRQYAYQNQLYNTSVRSLVDRAQRLDSYLDKLNQWVKKPYKQHYIFMNPGASQDLANELEQLGYLIN